MKLKIMRKDETFIGISDNKIILKRKNGDIRIVTIVLDEDGIRIAPDKELIITHGSGIVEFKDPDSGIETVTF